MNETKEQYRARIEKSILDRRLKDFFLQSGPLGDCVEEGEDFEKINSYFQIEEDDLILKTDDGFLLFFPNYDLIYLISEYKGYYKIYSKWTFLEYLIELE